MSKVLEDSLGNLEYLLLGLTFLGVLYLVVKTAGLKLGSEGMLNQSAGALGFQSLVSGASSGPGAQYEALEAVHPYPGDADLDGFDAGPQFWGPTGMEQYEVNHVGHPSAPHAPLHVPAGHLANPAAPKTPVPVPAHVVAAAQTAANAAAAQTVAAHVAQVTGAPSKKEGMRALTGYDGMNNGSGKFQVELLQHSLNGGNL